MFGLSITHLLVLVCVVAILFGGKNKISNIMGDLGKGLKELRHGLTDAEEASVEIKRLPTKEL
jgi:sec-independent protein translocase protein TatA